MITAARAGASGRARWRSVAGLTLGLALGLTLLVAPIAPAAGQPAPDAVSVRLNVTELTGVLGPGSVRDPLEGELPVTPGPDELHIRVLVENDGDAVLDALRLVIEVHEPALTRGLLHQAFEGTLDGTPLHVHSVAIGQNGRLAPGKVAGVADVFTRSEVDWADGPGGVHPVRIAVTRGTEVLDEAITAIVWLGSLPEAPLLTSLLWPLDTPPWRSTGGSYPDAAGREIRPGGRLDALLVAAEGARGTPLVLTPAAHLLEDLSDRGDGFDMTTRQEDGSLETRRIAAEDGDAELARQTLRRIRELASNQPHAPVSGTYADADLAAIAAGGGPIRELAAAAAVEGRRRVQLQLGTPVDAAVHLLDGPISPTVLDLLPGDAVLLPSRTVELPDLAGDPVLDEPVSTVRTPSGRLLTGLVADPYLERALASPAHRGGPLLTAQRTLAETAIAYLVAPGTPDRGLILLPPATWDISPRAGAVLLNGLNNATWIRLTAPGTLAAQARPSRAPLELTVPGDGVFRPELVSGLRLATVGLRSVEAAMPDPGARIQGRSLQEYRDDLLRATSRWYRSDAPGESDALIRDVQRTIDTTLGEVEVTSGTVTLTSDAGQVPVTLQRTRGGDLQVVVSVESQGRLLWPEGRTSETVLLREDGSQTVSFTTRALSTGTFPVTVRVTDPGGYSVIALTTLSVRSTAISGTALSGTGLLVVILLLFGAFRRRERHPGPLEVVDDP